MSPKTQNQRYKIISCNVNVLSIFLTFQKARAALTPQHKHRCGITKRKTVANLSSDDLKNTSHGAESADKRYLQREAAFLPGQRTSTDCTGLDD